MSKELERAAAKLSQHRERGKQAARAFLKVLVLEMESGGGKALAQEIGVSPAYLSDVKNGRRDVSDGLIEKILTAKLK